ncbi:MAG: NAD(P)/FAD-dependent oxidoreductase [Erysipelotrichaceae bacterium]
MKHYQVIIVGAGPSGLMAASNIKNKSILLIDANAEIGGKLKVSGGGRCNITNNKNINDFLLNIPKNQKFLYSCLTKFGPPEIIDFFNKEKVLLKEEDHGRVFPQDSSYLSIIKTFLNLLEKNKVKTLLNYQVQNVKKQNELFIIDENYSCDHLVIATGGISYKQFNTTGFGFDLAKKFRIKVTELNIVEAPLVSNDSLIRSKLLQGISIKDAYSTISINNKTVFEDTHDLLITHFGLSGPLALRASYYARKALNKKQSVLFTIDTSNCPNIPKKLKKYLIDNRLSFTINDVRGSSVGFITDGGIDLKEINPKTFESRKIKNLYFIGEVIDVHGFTGGYNLTLCLSEAYSLAYYLNN